MPEPMPRTAEHRASSNGVDVAGVARAMPGESACGDAWRAFSDGDGTTVLVSDGVGHGPAAAEASERALATVTELLRTAPGRPLDSLIRTCHEALRGTRGAALGLLRLEPRSERLSFCGVGNISLAAHPHRRGVGVSMPGMVGYRMSSVRVFETELCIGDRFALFSDGVSSRFALADLTDRSPDEAAAAGLAEFGKSHDDATLVVVHYPGPAPTGG